MSFNPRSHFWLIAFAFTLATGLAAPACHAQSDGINMSLHANSDKTTAADIGLPAYPGATPYKKDGDNSQSADLGFAFGDFKFTLKVADYQTSDSPAKVFGFYRTALGHYGQVLECDHGKPLGSPTVTNTGLTCGDDNNKKKDGDHGNGVQINGNNSSDSRELRAGTPKHYRIVALNDANDSNGKTRFSLIYLELPKDSDETN
jgi:hypothetical protein